MDVMRTPQRNRELRPAEGGMSVNEPGGEVKTEGKQKILADGHFHCVSCARVPCRAPGDIC